MSKRNAKWYGIDDKPARPRGHRAAAFLHAEQTSIVPDPADYAPDARQRTTDAPAAKALHVKLDLGRAQNIDARIDIARDPHDPRVIVLYDEGGKQSVAGLRLRIGPRTATWYLTIDKVEKGTRTAKLKKLGDYDRGVPSG